MVGRSRSWACRVGLVLVGMAMLAGCKFTSGAVSAGDAPISDGPTPSSDAPPPIDAAVMCDACDASNIPADWWNPSWKHRLTITVDGSKLTGSLTSFPVLVTLGASSAFAFTAAQANGNDLRFIDGDGTNSTLLAYDIDHLAANGPWLIWVKVPTLTMGTAHTITLYYGNPSAPATTSGATTFPDDVSVHHLNGDLVDASGNGHDGTATGTTTGNGKIAGGRVFNGTSDLVTLANSTTGTYDFKTALSVSLWLKAPTFTTAYAPFVAKGDHTWRAQAGNSATAAGDTDRAEFGTSDNTPTNVNDNLVGTTAVDDDAWHHVAMVYDGAKKYLYVDGALDASEAYTATLEVNTVVVSLGENADATPTRYFGGTLDEVRVTASARGAAWVRAEHDTVTVAAFTTLGAVDQAIE